MNTPDGRKVHRKKKMDKRNIEEGLSGMEERPQHEKRIPEYTVTVNGEERHYPAGTTMKKIAEDVQESYPYRIILGDIDGRLCELGRPVAGNCSVDFYTAADTCGYSAYVRTAIFILLKAVYDLGGKKNAERVMARWSVDNGIYFTLEGSASVTQRYVDLAKERMQKIIEEDIPIYKRTLRTEDAVRLFHRHHMYDKEKLFSYRRSSTVNVYSIESFDDYFYGYLADSTGAVKLFDLRAYDEGALLILPRRSSPDRLEEPVPQEKVFHVQKESREWGERMHVATVGDLNEFICTEGVRSLILVQEALHEAKIASIAEQIVSRKNVRFVMIAGPSSSGKTSFSYRLAVQLAAHGMRPHPICLDNYYVNREDTPLDENGERDYECLEALDIELFNHDMSELLRGKRVEMPTFNFLTGLREYKGDSIQLSPQDILLIEGIHGLNDRMTYALPEESRFRIYISALTSINIDEHNRIPTTDGRLIRRIVRDQRTRGTSAQETIARWPSVRRGEDRYIFKNQEKADVMFNSALVYELACLKVYAEPLLFGIGPDAAEYQEAKRLLKFLDYFLPVPGDEVPNNSLLREFIGGSIFRV